MVLPTLLWALTAFLCLGSSMAQSVSQTKAAVSGVVGQTVTLPCSYSTSDSSYYLYWYKKPPSGGLIYLIRQYSDSQNARTGRFSVSLWKAEKSINLRINALELGDSAVYFCAYSKETTGGYPPVETYPLIFGGGTSLTVVPRNQDYREPSVFLLKNESTYACVANNFYPKNAKIHMKLPGKKTITNIEHKAVTSDGKYSMVQITEFESDGAVNCTVEHEGKYVTPQQDKEKTDDSKTKTDKESTSKNSMSDSGKDDAQSNQQEAGPICREIKVRSEVVNTLSVTVLGLRVIFAKSVTLNLLLTAKYFFF